jgi:hypothetical protein
MLATQISFPALDAPALKTHAHRVTLVNHAQNQSMQLEVFTLSDSFSAVWREVNYQRQQLNLRGFVMDHEAEIECLTTPF